MSERKGNVFAAVTEAVTTSPWDWDKYTAAWVVWILWFAFWEAAALIGATNQTFSHHIWWLRNRGPSVIFFLLLGILAWLVYHFIWEGR